MVPTQKEPSVRVKPDWRRAYSIVFLAIVFSMLVLQLFVPEITPDTISEKYLWRKSLISAYSKVKFGMGDQVFWNAIVGKEGWFFLTGELSLQNYQKNDPLKVSSIKKLAAFLNQINEAVARYGGTFIVVVPPDKSTVYPQYMPDEIPVIGTVTSLDRLIERVNKFSDIRLLDLRPSLLGASTETQLYYKTDTHWNCLGAFYAYEEIILEIAKEYPDIPVHTLNDFEISISQKTYLDLARIMNINVKEELMSAVPDLDGTISVDYDHMAEYSNKSLRVVVNSNKELPTLMVFHDSFYSACLNVYLEPSFGQTISIPYNDVEMAEMLQMIEREQPDVVILEFVERLMEHVMQKFGE